MYLKSHLVHFFSHCFRFICKENVGNFKNIYRLVFLKQHLMQLLSVLVQFLKERENIVHFSLLQIYFKVKPIIINL